MDTGNPFIHFRDFSYSPALGPEEGVTRRDPSPVILVGDTYHVWYSRTESGPDGYSATVWTATSTDGHAWTERGEALGRGPVGAFDEHALFTPSILVARGRYYLFYTAVPEPFTNDGGGPGGTRTAIGLAAAESPAGPWIRLSDEPVLRTSDDPDQFDSHRVDDSCLLVRDGRYWLYYKGRQMQRTPGQTRMGLAIAEAPEGPYVKCGHNPVLDSGHEVCVWPHGAGTGCLVAPVGPQGGTLQYGDDGIHFSRCADVTPPSAPGPFRPDLGGANTPEDGAGPGITWGLCQQHGSPWPYLERFECDLAWRSPDLGEG